MKNDVTLSDIAKKIGVSQVTVSKALSGKSGVSRELRNKIVKTADEMGYKITRASKKKTGKTQCSVGVIASERFLRDKEAFYWKLYQELAIVFSKERINSLLEVVTTEAESCKEEPNLLMQGKIDALIILGAFDTEYLFMLNNSCNVPLLSVDSLYYEIDGDAVIIDNMAGGYKMTEYLLGLGHKKIGYVGSLNNTPSIDDRYMGYCKALILNGITPCEEWHIADRDNDKSVKDPEDFSLPAADKMPTAFFCNCDYVAQLFIEKLKMSGYKVPEDVSVVGFDNYVPRMKAQLGLTTYEVDLTEVAAMTASKVRKIMGISRSKYTTSVVRGRIIERESAKGITS